MGAGLDPPQIAEQHLKPEPVPPNVIALVLGVEQARPLERVKEVAAKVVEAAGARELLLGPPEGGSLAACPRAPLLMLKGGESGLDGCPGLKRQHPRLRMLGRRREQAKRYPYRASRIVGAVAVAIDELE